MAGRADAAITVQRSRADLVPVDEFTDDQKTKVARARQWGIVNPNWAMQAALWAGIPYYVLCAYLKQESAGGQNAWGSDDTWMRGIVLRQVGITAVSEELYLAYRIQRDELGNQGVGPMQLTSPGFQDRADQLGGCWNQLPNMLAACETIAVWKRTMNWHEVAKRYNGSESYAVHNDSLRAEAKAVIVKGEDPS